jgi:hypothetical protein
LRADNWFTSPVQRISTVVSSEKKSCGVPGDGNVGNVLSEGGVIDNAPLGPHSSPETRRTAGLLHRYGCTQNQLRVVCGVWTDQIEVVVRPMSSRSLRAALAGCLQLQVRAPRNI